MFHTDSYLKNALAYVAQIDRTELRYPLSGYVMAIYSFTQLARCSNGYLA